MNEVTMLKDYFQFDADRDVSKYQRQIAADIEAAFQRGVQAGRHTTQKTLPFQRNLVDAVTVAQTAEITCVYTLSNLYAKEQGFKQ